MLRYLANYEGKLLVNGQLFSSIKAANNALKDYKGEITVILNPKDSTLNQNKQVPETIDNQLYRIKVRQYMIKPSSPDFDFHTKWNNDIPMPLRVMVGRKLKETKGMVKMELWGDITQTVTTHCMKCGKVLTNPVSRFFGIGPECGGHNYTNPFSSDEELAKAVEDVRKQLHNITWTGWIIKSAIEEEELYKE